MSTNLTKVQIEILRQYQHTDDWHFMQGIAGVSELWRPLGLLEWHGEQYGTHFYSITDAGRAALAKASGEQS